MTENLLFVLGGGALLLAVVLPPLLHRFAISAPIVLIAVGALIGLLPLSEKVTLSPVEHRLFTEKLTEVAVIVALMGVGLALDRPLSWRRWSTWRSWDATWRLLALAMPLTIAGVALLGWWAMGLAPAAALLLGAALAPTDPVLASDVQVQGPTSSEADPEEIDERDEVRFALTSEAGLNDGMAFPFVYAAIFLASMGPVTDWGLQWIAWELVGKLGLGVVVGTTSGWVLARLAFSRRSSSRRLTEVGEPLLALAAVLLSYGLTQAAGGYGFLAVFACAMTLRSAERGSEYHAEMHQTITRLEQLLTLVVLLLLGAALTQGLLAELTWAGALVGVLLVFVVRPAAAYLSLRLGPRPRSATDVRMTRAERWATAFFGVRGVGSLYYLAYGLGSADFGPPGVLWSTVAFVIVLSVVVHGVAATPVMRRLELVRDTRTASS